MASENEQERRETLADIVAELRMGDDGGKPAYRIGRADKVEVSLPSGTPMRSYVIEYVTIKELADWIEAAVARERRPGNAAAHAMTLDEAIAHAEDVADRCDTSCGREHRQLADWLKELRDVKSRHVGNAAAMREALELALDALISWLNGTIDRTTNRETIKAIRAALAAPARQCDVGTPEEQTRRMAAEYCAVQKSCYESPSGRECPLHKSGVDCRLIWAQMPYEAEGGAGE